MKKLNLFQALAIGLGNIIGAGIFVMVGAGISASGPSVLLAFLITALYASTVGLNNAELASDFPNVEGGVYSFAYLTLGETIGFLVGWFRVIGYAISGGATALGFSSYLLYSLGITSSYLVFLIAILLIVILSVVNYFGLKLASEIESIFVVLNISGLFLFSVITLLISGIRLSNFEPFMPYGVSGLLTASGIAFFAYSGFNTIATLTPSTENGERVIPKAIVLSLLISALLYMLVTFSMVDAVNYKDFGTSAAPLQLVMSRLREPIIVYSFVNLTAILATVTVTLSTIIATERTFMQMVEDKMIPLPFGGRKSVLIIIAVIMASSLGLGNVEIISLVSNFGIVFSYMLSGVEVMIARHRGIRGKFRAPLFPYLQVLSFVLSGVFILSLGFVSLEIGFITLLIGLIIHGLHKEIVKHKEKYEIGKKI
ncbi:amino acid permease [Sulfolobaceae archaeon RB850M]|jgi:APA family basic amino acid/polyamine antiporter